MNRREFLSLGALTLAPLASPAAAAPRRLRAAPATQSLVGPAYPATAVWAYDGSVPGPELRLRQGARLRAEVENALAAPTTVHFHGIRLPNAMDGVPHLTQPPIAADGGRFLYEFDLPDAGTYWYHPHLGSPEQVGRGLYGALIVEERKPPEVDRDLVWVLSDWRLDREARNLADFGSFMDASHAGRIGNTVTVNGSVRERFDVRAGERLRLRLVNASNARVYGLEFEGHEPWLVALDGQPVAPRRAPRIVLGPAMRADLILDCRAAPGTRHRIVDTFYAQRAYRLMDLAYRADKPLRASFAPVPALPRNPFPRPDVASAVRHRVVFEGGMMGRMRPGAIWTVNGTAMSEDMQHGAAPLFELARGRSYQLELVNDTAWWHPIHLHGHVFGVVSRDGERLAAPEWRDTELLPPRGRAEIAFVADNPGDWMLHCHVLEHQAAGMMAFVRVG